MRRRPIHARLRAHARYGEVLRSTWRRAGALAGSWYLLLGLAHFLWPNAVSGVLVGVLLVVPPWIVSLLVVSDPSAAAWARGADAEEWTAHELRRIQRSNCVVLNDVQLGNVNADHILVGPFGVVVVETKWSAKRWATRDGYERLRSACKQARYVATLIGRRLSDAGVTVEPNAVVVAWGGRASQWLDASQRVVDGTHVIAGTAVREWLRTFDTMPTVLTRDAVDAAVAALDDRGAGSAPTATASRRSDLALRSRSAG